MLEAEKAAHLLENLYWELAIIGDPLLDVGFMAVCYPERGELMTPTQELSAALLESGFPSRSEIFDRYAARSGRDLSGLGWSAASAAWKMAARFPFSHPRGPESLFTRPMRADLFRD